MKFQYDSTDTDLKILDFGFARHLKTDEILQNQVGTICYEGKSSSLHLNIYKKDEKKKKRQLFFNFINF